MRRRSVTGLTGPSGPPAYIELCKAGLTTLVVATTAVGFVLGQKAWGSGVFPYWKMIWTLFGTFLTAGGSVAMNQAWEWRRDARMERTHNRPVPTGRIPFLHALRFGGICVAIGLFILITRSGSLAAALGLADAAIYVLVYTPLKPRTPLCTLVGAICGAIPPMMGWAAATGRCDLGAWILGAMLFLWQIPHFLALAWLYREDYEKGGFRILPVIDRSGDLTARLAVLYSLATIPLAIASVRFGMGGRIFLAGAFALGGGILLIGIRLMRHRTEARARALFFASIIYLPLLLGLLVADSGCAGVRQLAALHQVEFRFDRVADPRVAGIRLSNVHSPEDVSPIDLGRLAIAIATKDVPLDLTVHVMGRNPETNTVTAKLIGLDWSYIVDGRETVSGKVTEGYEFPPGQPTDMGLQVTFNLLDLAGGNGKDLLDTALALTGQRMSTHTVTMELRPEIDTPIGPMRYPTPIDLNLATATK